MILHVRFKSQEHARFLFMLAMLIVLLFARYGLQIGVPRFLLTGTIVLTALVSSRNEILALALCCIPWCEAVDIAYALFACAGTYVIKYNKEIRINIAVVLVLSIIFWELLHCFEHDFSIIVFLFSLVTLVFLGFVLCIDPSELDYAFIVRIMATATVAICTVLLLQLIVRANYDIGAAIVGLQRLGLISEDDEYNTLIGSAINPNSLGIICVLSITALLQLRTIKLGRKLDDVLSIVLLIFGSLTSSRTFAVCVVIMAVCMTFAQPGNIKKKVRFICIILVLLVVSILLLSWIFPELLEYYVSRFKDGNLSGGRSALFKIYHRYILDNADVMFFGVGRNNFSIKLIETYRVAVNMPHNMIQETIVMWGIPGLIMILILMGMLVTMSVKYSHRHVLLNYVPLLIIAVKSVAGQLLTAHYTMLALSYAYLSLCQDFRPKVEQ